MYGFIHCCLHDLILKKFGEETWNTIIKEAGVNLAGGEYIIHRVYSDQETMKLVTVVQKLSGIPLNDILETFGDHFYKYCKQSGYERILKVLGRNMREFLCNLDALHDHLGSIYPGMNAPSFRASERPDGGLDLHYYSNRDGLGYIVIGIMKIVARECFNTEIEMSIDKEKQGKDDHVIFAVFEKAAGRHLSIPVITFPPAAKFVHRSSTITSLKSVIRRKKHFMNINSFTEAFPFHVVFDKNLNIKQCGTSISKYIEMSGVESSGKLKKKHKMKYFFTDAFRLIRPKMDFTFENIRHHINTVFVVTSKHRLELNRKASNGKTQATPIDVAQTKKFALTSILSTASVCMPKIVSSNSKGSELKLKGQMIYLRKIDCLLFLCSPRVGSLEELEKHGLYLSDFPLHDATREVILTNKEHQQDRQLVKRIEDSNNGLKILQSKLVYNKKITDELLYELLPPKVAQQLRLNLPVLAESYDIVTILFSDLVGFTALCSNEHVVPMDIVKLLNKLYTMFDVISNMHNVYKVETIGDAYMGVCGLPVPLDDHAEKILDMAIDMLECIKNVVSPVDSHPVKIRIGLHSGACMAGVVGKKTPRYCLFGKTVTIANKMESGSSPGRINVSVDTKKFLDEKCWTFEPNSNPNPLECFFIERKVINPAKEEEKRSFLKQIASLDTHLKESSPATSRKSIGNVNIFTNVADVTGIAEENNNNNNNNDTVMNHEKRKAPIGCPFSQGRAKML